MNDILRTDNSLSDILHGLENLRVIKKKEIEQLVSKNGGNPEDYQYHPRITCLKVNSAGDVVREIKKDDGTIKTEYVSILHPTSLP